MRVQERVRVSKGLRWYVRLGPERNTKAGGGEKKGSLGKEAGGGMEAKKKEGVSTCPVLPEG